MCSFIDIYCTVVTELEVWNVGLATIFCAKLAVHTRTKLFSNATLH